MDGDVHGTVKARSALALLGFGLALFALGLRPPAARSITLVVTGDIMLGRDVARAHVEGGWEHVLAALAPYATQADLSFANLESPLTQADLVTPALDLRAPLDAALALQGSHLTLVSLANNHSLDAGPAGLQDTFEALAAAGVDAVGPGMEPWVGTVGGFDVAWIAFNDVGNPLALDQATAAIGRARAAADLVLVSVHWGAELDPGPSPRQREIAEALASAGADLVVGHHPHVLQPVEWIWGLGRGHPTLVAFSLGNAVFDQEAPPGVRQGALLRVTMDGTGVQSVCAVALAIEPSRWEAAPADAASTLAILQRLNREPQPGLPLRVGACP